MEYKILGENKVRDIYKEAPSGLSYTIVSTTVVVVVVMVVVVVVGVE